MSSGSTSKGWLGTKRKVTCGYCGTESRLDNLRRHINTIHGKDVDMKFNAIEPKESVKAFFFKKKEESDDHQKYEDMVPEYSMEDVETEESCEVGDVRDCDDDNLNTNKGLLKRKVEDSDNEDKTPAAKISHIDIDHFDRKLDEFGDKLYNKFDERMNTMEQIIKEKKGAAKVTIGNLDNKEEQMLDVLMACIDIKSVENSLGDFEFGKADENDEEIVFYCKICFENNPPPPDSDQYGIGCFKLDLKTYEFQKTTNPDKQPKTLGNLKTNIKKHIQASQNHKQKYEDHLRKQKILFEKESRNKIIGLNLFRIRYTAIKQHQPRTAFEENVLTAKLNGVDVGDINNSRIFAKDIDTALFETMKDDLKEALTTKLEATNEKRPLGLIFDKMTPAKETGQIHAVVIPVPENPLSQPLLVPICLDVPTVTDHSISGLAKLSKSVLNNVGAEDTQLEGIAVDGEYVKKGIKEKLLEYLDIPKMTDKEKDDWITMVWDPAHELELAVNDARKDSVFEWFNLHIRQINEATEMLNIGKGLQQSLSAATDLDQKLYKLRNMSSTRFAAYFFKCLDNNEKSLSISIEVLREKSLLSSKKEIQEKAGNILKCWKTQQWMAINIGLIDIFRLLGQTSKRLQKVELFPWEIVDIQENVIKDLRKMSEIKMTNEKGNDLEKQFDKKLWTALDMNIEKILRGEYKGQETTVFQMFRRGRSADDIRQSSLSLLLTIQNRLSSFCRIVANNLEERLNNVKDHKSTNLIKTMGKCLNVRDILKMGEDKEFNIIGEQNLKIILSKAKYSENESATIHSEYRIFKKRLHELNLIDKSESELIQRNEHILYKVHECTDECTAKYNKTCKEKNKLIFPKEPIPIKFLQLFLKYEELYSGIECFLHLMLRCLLKTHAETVAESMGNLVAMHCDKRRGLGIEDVGKETFINWNGPPVHMADSLGVKTLNRLFKGKKWHFVTRTSNLDSEVIKRLKSKPAKVPFFKNIF